MINNKKIKNLATLFLQDQRYWWKYNKRENILTIKDKIGSITLYNFISKYQFGRLKDTETAKLRILKALSNSELIYSVRRGDTKYYTIYNKINDSLEIIRKFPIDMEERLIISIPSIYAKQAYDLYIKFLKAVYKDKLPISLERFIESINK